MGALLTEVVTYIIKFFAMIFCAGLGIYVGKILRKRKNEKIAAENTEQ
ncbi:MAG: hypothetical protein NC225_05175 [Clostridium sp.]|nr:hypothetical protein [Clostridium sp.]MCM1398858.1 hypothetical protein [Clostridium sp.]MCM1458511.1 hypothetical protein [Bacteroides sp.]